MKKRKRCLAVILAVLTLFQSVDFSGFVRAQEETGGIVTEDQTESAVQTDGTLSSPQVPQEETEPLEPLNENEETYSTFQDMAEAYYGENAADPQQVASLQITRSDGLGGSVKAGQILSLRVEYTLSAAPTFNYGNQVEQLFDTYENTVIRLRLPEGLAVTGGDGTLTNIREYYEDPDEPGTWIFVLNNSSISAQSSTVSSFSVNILVEGNGSLEIGHVFDFGSSIGNVDTSFTVMDRTQSPAQAWKTYHQSNQSGESLGTVTSVSDDIWNLQKTVVSTTVAADKSDVTVRFQLEAGLEDGSGGILTDPNAYAREGRTPFDGSASLTETLTVTDRQGSPIAPTQITVTPQFGGSAINMTNQSTADIPVDTCGNHGLSGVDGNAPYYSVYYVDAVYPYGDFIAQYYDQNQDLLAVQNTAVLNYQLLGGTSSQSEDSASVNVGEVTQPAALTIRKYIHRYDEDNAAAYELYEGTDWAPVTGAAVFQITDAAGQAPTLYTRNADGTYSKLDFSAGQEISINPSGAADAYNGTDGTITVYLDPGTYTVKETGLPANTEKAAGDALYNGDDKTLTVGAGETKTADFYNDEVLGEITVEKTGLADGVSSALANAQFGLYSDSACTQLIASGSTDSDGRLIFGRLPAGTWYVREIQAPDGYIADSTVHTVTLTPENLSAEHVVKSENQANSAYVLLQKQYYYYTGNNFRNVDASNYQEFNGCFAIERSLDGGKTWTTAVDSSGTSLSGLSLNSNGQGSRLLPVYEGDTLISYRIKETLPAGWHANDEKNEDGRLVAYSVIFDLKDELGQGINGAEEITMQNTRRGSFTLTKTFYQATSNGMTAVNAGGLEASFTLYCQSGSGPVTEAGTYTTVNGVVTALDLLINDADGNNIQYYWAEAGRSDDYEPAETAGGTTEKNLVDLKLSDGNSIKAYGPYSFNDVIPSSDGTGGEKVINQEITVSNIQQKVPVVVKKADSYSGAFVPGAKYSVYRVADNETETVVTGMEDIEIPSSGSLALLEPGYLYRIEEAETPAGYTDVSEAASLIVDLRNITNVTADTKAETVIIKNQPAPSISVRKERKNAGGDNTVLTGVSFEVYKKDSGGNFIRALDYQGNPLSVTSGSGSVRLPAGTYYLKEVVPEGNANGVLDPQKYAALYKNGITPIEIDSQNNVYFGPFDVSQQQQTHALTVVNYSELGAVTVSKLADAAGGADTPLSGAVLKIYRKDTAGRIFELGANGTAYTVTTGASGMATFSGLPIYDEQGSPYTYYIREVSAPSGYTLDDAELSATLKPGQTVTPGEGNNLVLINRPELVFEVTKSYYNIWEEQFTHKAYLLPGAEIALYQKNTDGTYTLVEVQTTGSLGTVSFEGLSQAGEYVAVEVSVPDEEAYRYLEPVSGKDYLERDGEGKLPETLTQEALDQYYYVTKSPNSGDPETLVRKDMYNVEHWAQLHIEKYKLKENLTDGEKILINHAEFTLYQQILPEGQTDTALSFDPDNCTVVGSYSSGTLYDTDGNRRDGEFVTDILKSADNVVYWLVETKAGPGSEIMPENQIILFKRQGTNYTNHSRNPYAENEVFCDDVYSYEDDVRTDTTAVQNSDVTGTGVLRYASVRISKWAGQYDVTGEALENYTPLGNVQFDLYLVDEAGNRLALLDTLTTGLDNDLGDQNGGEETEDDELNGWAASQSFEFDELKEQYGNLEGGDTAIWEEGGTGYARVALVESSAPLGYQANSSVYYMLMCFAPESADTEQKGYTETFNDAFYVKDNSPEIPLADELNRLEEIQWIKIANDEAGSPIEEITDQTGTSYRLVNWPIDNYSVTVQKYGYTPDGSNLNMSGAQLDDYYDAGIAGRVALSGVKMRLERYDGKNQRWVAWDYTEQQQAESNADAEFVTGSSGAFTFPKGLNIGEYRIIEVAGDSRYENIYNGSAISGGIAAFWFNVVNDNLQLSMYNPAKLSLEVTKTDMDGNPVQNFTFQLKTGNTAQNSSTDQNGTAVFSNLETGTYILSEMSGNSGYSTAYLEKYFSQVYSDTDAYPDLDNDEKADLLKLTGTGLFLGYTTAAKVSESGCTEVYVTQVRNMADYGITDLVKLTVKNPRKVSLTVKKTDLEDDTAVLSGAVFRVEYQPFAAVSGELSPSDGSWTALSGVNTTTGQDGTFTLAGRDPGFYRVTETQAPSGYEMVEGQTEKIIAVTGGLNISVPEDSGIELYRGTPDEDGIVLAFRNRKLVSLTVDKAVSGIELPDGTYTFSFRLYDSADAGSPLKTAAATLTKNGNGTSVQTAVFSGLSQGKTYYLEEVLSGNDFRLTGMQTAAGTALPEANGRYAVTIPASGNQDVAVTAENQYMHAQVSLLKINGNTGEALEGAVFQAYRVTRDDQGIETETPVDGQDIVWTSSGGVYTCQIRLYGDEETIRFYEETAPENYVRQEGCVEVTLTPGQSLRYETWNADEWDEWKQEHDDEQMLDALVVPNYNGAFIQLTKYDDVSGASDPQGLQGAVFSIYELNNGSWTYLTQAATGADGTLRVAVAGGICYAIAETVVPEGYADMESLWQVSRNGTGAETGREQITRTATAGDGSDRTIYILNEGDILRTGSTCELAAYNAPYLSLEVRKTDASGASAVPRADFSVYQIPENLIPQSAEGMTRAEINALIRQKGVTAVAEHVTTSRNRGDYTYADSSVNPNLGRIVAGRTYLIVENEVSAASGGTYDTMILDDERTTWYVFHKATADASQTVTLTNVLGHAGVSLEKTAAETNSLDSLFTSGATLHYTLTPQVGDNTYGLDSYVLSDTGLNAYHNQTLLDFDAYLKDRYSVTSVVLQPSTHDVTHYAFSSAQAEMEAEQIDATVTWVGFDGAEIYSETVRIDQQEQTVSLPAHITEKAREIRISYESPVLRRETGYGLGHAFHPGSAYVTVVLDQQQGGETVQTIDRIRNKSEAVITYRTWNSQGEQASQADATRAEDEDQAGNAFEDQETAVVTVQKKADQASVNLKDQISYTVTVQNAQSAGAAMEEPVIVDYLPQGSSLDTSAADAVVLLDDGNSSGLTVSHYRTENSGDETVVLIFLAGSLKPGDSVSVRLTVTAEDAVVSYGASMVNHVYITSDVRGVASEENPSAASFRNGNHNWAEPLSTVAADLGSARLATLQRLLGSIANYGYISASASAAWNTVSNLTLIKSGYGSMDEEGSYSSSLLSSVENGGAVNYRLTVSNNSNTEGAVRLSVVDVLPAEGDYVSDATVRGSQWPVAFREIKEIRTVDEDGTVTEIGSTNYVMYFYHGDLAGQSDYTNVYQAAKNAVWGTDFTDAQWNKDPKGAKAFLIVFSNDITLGIHERMEIDYAADVDTYTENELADIAYKNAVNSFACNYSYYSLSGGGISQDNPVKYDGVLGSNSVSVTIFPTEVKVGGHVWIDVNENGVWESGESISDLAAYDIVSDMMDEIEIRLFRYTNSTDIPAGSLDYDQTLSSTWKQDGNYVFDELRPSDLQEGIDNTPAEDEDLTGHAYDQNNNLLVDRLKGSNPNTYMMSVTLPQEITGDFRFTSEGITNGISQNPEELNGDYLYIPAAEQTDSNFAAQTDTAATSERFFLWSADITNNTNWDNTKDVGLVLKRSLEIYKTAEDNHSDMVEGASFIIYGPFAAGTDYSQIDWNKQAGQTVTTDENGFASLSDLSWFQEYVIVETAAGTGYVLDDAAAYGDNIRALTGTSLQHGWVLGVPGTDSMITADTVTVTNVRQTEAVLEASKTLNGNLPDEGQFTFQLLDSNEQVIEEVVNGKDGTAAFSPLTFEGEDSHTYYIREKVPASGSENGVTYDTVVYRVVITTEWNESKKQLEPSVLYYADGSTVSSTQGALFQNHYEASGSLALTGEKTVNGGEPGEDEIFTFTLQSVGNTPQHSQSVTNRRGEIIFDPISYSLADVGETYTYEIRETSKSGNGYTVDSAVYLVTVQVQDQVKDGQLEITSVIVRETASGSQKETEKIVFQNTYAAEPVTCSLEVEKTVEGSEMAADKTFTFTQRMTQGQLGGVEMPKNNTAQITVSQSGSQGTQSASFAPITFLKEGIYDFVIEEEQEGLSSHYSYDSSVWIARVTVTDQNGKLRIDQIQYLKGGVTPSESGKASFVNHYDTGLAYYTPRVIKELSGDQPRNPKTFTFRLRADADNPQGGAVLGEAAAQVTASVMSGTLETTFGEITFSQPGTYRFYLTEDTGTPGDGFTYDDREWTLTVEVAVANEALTVTGATYQTGDEETETAVFANSYQKNRHPDKPEDTDGGSDGGTGGAEESGQDISESQDTSSGESQPAENAAATAVSTGDNAPIILLTVIMAAAVLIIVWTVRKNRQNSAKD